MDAVAPILFGKTECYVPPRGEPEQIAQVLASHYGLLVPERTGYVDAYPSDAAGRGGHLAVSACMTCRRDPEATFMSSENSRTYHGWPTYETWLVYSWLTNDAATYGLVLATVADAGPRHADEALKTLVEELEPLADEVGLHRDLLTASYGHVDWQALANAFAEHGR